GGCVPDRRELGSPLPQSADLSGAHCGASRFLRRRTRGRLANARASGERLAGYLVMSSAAGIFVHRLALCESDEVGSGTQIWAFAHVMKGAVIGRHCNIGDHAFIETGARIGDRVTVKNQAMVWDGIEIGDDVFVGPGVSFTNDAFPRSPRTRLPAVAAHYSSRGGWLLRT